VTERALAGFSPVGSGQAKITLAFQYLEPAIGLLLKTSLMHVYA
jgi:hypothetical protein